LTALPPFELERFFAQHEFTVELNACASDVEAPSMAEVLEWASPRTREAWETLRLGYTEAPGHPRLRQAIAGLYGDDVTADDVLVFAGAEEAIFAFASTELGPGDHAVVVWPSYQSLHEVARANGAEVTLLELRHDEGWALDPEALRRALRGGRGRSTKAVVINTPHNPTGAHLDRATYDAVVGLCEDAGARLFGDEVYRWGEHDPADRLPAAVEVSATALSLGVMSKTFALPGLRIGWAASRDRALLDRLATFKDYTTICSSAPSELLAIAALEGLDALLTRTRSIVEPNLQHLDAFFARHADALEWVRPRGAPIGFPRVLAPGGVAHFAEHLLAEQGTLILPGRIYGHEGEHFRLGFGRRDLPEALERMERVL
jgi:aspartate/methionine/tyrosine aminotransferase